MLNPNTVPQILVSPSTQQQGAEFSDLSLSLSKQYTDAILNAGALPIIMPPTLSRPVIAELVRRSDGVLLTGGDDLQPGLYTKELSPELAKTTQTHDAERDAWELELIAEVFNQRKPFLGICRGHQLLNVALGGTLIVDIPSQVPGALNHKQFERKAEPVHELALTEGSLLAKITGAQSLHVNSTHHQAIGKLASALAAVGRTSDGIVEAVELKEPGRLPYLLAVQFHPERLWEREPAALGIFTSFVQACGHERRKKL
jgi:putative glutamine amidotransferase